jgi:type VII secretion-associated serine protease mycosin
MACRASRNCSASPRDGFCTYLESEILLICQRFAFSQILRVISRSGLSRSLLACTLIFFCLPLLGLSPQRTAAAAAETAEYRPSQLLVKLKPATKLVLATAPVTSNSSLLSVALSQYDVTRATSIDPEGRTYALHYERPISAPELAERLQRIPEVVYAEPDYCLKATLLPDDPYYQSFQWGLPQIEMEKAWDITTGDPSIIVAVLDTGVASDHPDLAGKVIAGYDFVNNDDNPYDDNGHGTFTAGIAAARGNDGTGVAGVSWGAQIMPVKILNSEGAGSVEDFTQGIRYAADHGARVINVSAGMPVASRAMADAVDYAYSKGCFLVAAAGNTPDGQPNYPAAFDQVEAVGASGRNDTTTGFSSFGQYLDVVAPGAGIVSTSWSDGDLTYDSASGTSASAPFVSGLASLILSVRPDLTNTQIKQIIESTADDEGPSGWDEHFGNGRINAYRAVLVASTGQTKSGQSRIVGTVTGAPVESTKIVLQPGPETHPDATGHYEFDSLPAGDYTVLAVSPGYAVDNGPVAITLSGGPDDARQIDFHLSPAANSAFAPVAPIPDSPDQRYFTETGHSLSFGFKIYWESRGSLPLFGLPISEEFQENGYTVQYFERARFEYHPEYAGTPYETELGLLGREATNWIVYPPIAPFDNTAERVFFPETGHSLARGFLAYWQQHGGLAIFGLPISEEIQENGYSVQYFERNRFEYHPELPAEFQVSLGLLGRDLAGQKGWLQ